ncbi:MAG: T9SS type A sorting domain-containing protein [Candidatus Sumerlaeia bacterium]|nr:T9SS type A sorting domain-containing protein [Candidatus Sumerlaeia bacterium]
MKIYGTDFNGTNTNMFYGDTAVYHNYVPLEMSCTKIESYRTGILTINTTLGLNEGYNRFLNTVDAITLQQSTGLYLQDGENVFTGSLLRDIKGSIQSNASLVLINGDIDGSKNTIDVNKIALQYGGLPIGVVVPGMGASEYCPEPFGLSNPFDGLLVIPTDIEVDYNGNLPFSSALLLATDNVFGNEEYEGYLYPALIDLIEIMDQVSTSINVNSAEHDKMAFSIGLTMTLDVLRLNYHYGHIEPASAEPSFPINTYVSSLINYVEVIVDVLDTLNDEMKADWDIIKAHIYRLGEYHPIGLEILGGISGNISSDMENRRDYWYCVMSWEQEFLQGNMEIETFYQEMATCYDMFNPYITHEEEDIIVANDFMKPKDFLDFYPNPTQSMLYVKMDKIAKPDDEVEVTITGMDGKTLHKHIEPASYLIGINVENLPQGAYILTITTPYKKHNGQFLIAR